MDDLALEDLLPWFVREYGRNITGLIQAGAHVGAEYKLLRDIPHLLLFEPQPSLFAQLRACVGSEVMLVNKALGRCAQKVVMYVETRKNGMSSSILPPLEVRARYPRLRFDRQIEVEQIALDAFLATLDHRAEFNCLMMDVQGYELEVLRGAEQSLKSIDFIYTEVNVEELYKGCALIGHLDEYLGQRGFTRVRTSRLSKGWGDAVYCKVSPLGRYSVGRSCQIPTLGQIYERYLGFVSDGAFVDVGAYNGWKHSNTNCLAHVGWRGLLIEPVPAFVAQCQRYYRHMPKVKVIATCAGERDGMVSLYVSEAALSTTIKRRAEWYRQCEWARTSAPAHGAIESPCRRLDGLLAEEKWPVGFEVLSIDVEGGEIGVLNGFTIEYWRPRIVIIETHELSEEAELCADAEWINSYFQNHGYVREYVDAINSVFVRHDVFESRRRR